MLNITEARTRRFGHLPEKVLQFGEGNFLRAFADWMIELANRDGLFQGSVLICQPIPDGLADCINQQAGMYTLIMRGTENGYERSEEIDISSVSRCINPYQDYASLLEAAANPDLAVIISNTTEAGIAYRDGQSPDDAPPASFPAKLAVFLHRRFTALGGSAESGLLVLPVELIDNNGDILRQTVLRHAAEWKYPAAFTIWLEEHVCFANTLVDRIVTGHPTGEMDEIQAHMGCEDKLLVTSELFNLWVIEADQSWADRFPIHKTAANVVWTDDVTPYKRRKVRILNGAHTAMVLAASLAGHETVLDCMRDELFRQYLEDLLFEEVIPSLDMPRQELEPFARSVLDRFNNPFIRHRLLDIALNSSAKFTARCLPSILDHQRKTGRLPKRLVYALAAFLVFYRGRTAGEGYLGIRQDGSAYPIRDDAAVLTLFDQAWNGPTGNDPEALVTALFKRPELWGGSDLTAVPGLTAAVSEQVRAILEQGPRQVLVRMQQAE